MLNASRPPKRQRLIIYYRELHSLSTLNQPPRTSPPLIRSMAWTLVARS